jgi:hypothetical protein
VTKQTSQTTLTMKKKRKIGPIDQEFIYKQGMKERLIEAYQITVKDIWASQEENNEYTQSNNAEASSYLCEGLFIKTK